ncbi:hypothetical protein M8C21_029249, partial [Ambrosia artemisiifolia]
GRNRVTGLVLTGFDESFDGADEGRNRVTGWVIGDIIFAEKGKGHRRAGDTTTDAGLRSPKKESIQIDDSITAPSPLTTAPLLSLCAPTYTVLLNLRHRFFKRRCYARLGFVLDLRPDINLKGMMVPSQVPVTAVPSDVRFSGGELCLRFGFYGESVVKEISSFIAYAILGHYILWIVLIYKLCHLIDRDAVRKYKR